VHRDLLPLLDLPLALSASLALLQILLILHVLLILLLLVLLGNISHPTTSAQAAPRVTIAPQLPLPLVLSALLARFPMKARRPALRAL